MLFKIYHQFMRRKRIRVTTAAQLRSRAKLKTQFDERKHECIDVIHAYAQKYHDVQLIYGILHAGVSTFMTKIGHAGQQQTLQLLLKLFNRKTFLKKTMQPSEVLRMVRMLTAASQERALTVNLLK